ncbi:MAG: ybfL [Rhodospirillales bacterium]|nr:ybfL [Rhodospirillales bacterium]
MGLSRKPAYCWGIRSHWAVENSLYWVLDMVFRDDECRVKTDNAPANFTTIKHIATNLLRLPTTKDSLRSRRKIAAWDDTFLASLIAHHCLHPIPLGVARLFGISLKLKPSPASCRADMPMEAVIARRMTMERINLSGGEVGLLRLGAPDRPAVVFVHGFSGDLLTWQYNLFPLTKDYHVVAIDLPGHGRSEPLTGAQHWQDMVDWLSVALATLGLKRPHLVGHSLGGRLMLGMVERRLISAASLSLIACAGLGPGHDYPFLKRLASIETLEDALVCTRHLFSDHETGVERFACALHAKLSTAAARTALTQFLNANLRTVN